MTGYDVPKAKARRKSIASWHAEIAKLAPPRNRKLNSPTDWKGRKHTLEYGLCPSTPPPTAHRPSAEPRRAAPAELFLPVSYVKPPRRVLTCHTKRSSATRHLAR
jgi:hypothetical protein